MFYGVEYLGKRSNYREVVKKVPFKTQGERNAWIAKGVPVPETPRYVTPNFRKGMRAAVTVEQLDWLVVEPEKK